ncbi:MAG: malonate decarboxylase subunit alpha [Pseudomonadota bacterium]
MTDWQRARRARDERLAAGSKFAVGKLVAPNDATALLEAVIRPGDRVCLEGDNQKQADFLAASLAKADAKVLHDLHIVQSGIVLAEHIDPIREGGSRRNSTFPSRGRRATHCRARFARGKSNSGRSTPMWSCSRVTSRT